MDCLKAGSWNLEASIDFYYASGMATTAPSMDGKALETLFARYKGMQGPLSTKFSCLSERRRCLSAANSTLVSAALLLQHHLTTPYLP
jgi:hypothetical protein